ncbi:MAG TPA: sigma-70 family RNA polymerase sigma factor [Pirellulaceae bacterium]|nr:sigma-70 family RNA polymerase sigma factor [Pirellulaceae bacterium]HMO94149.1 sigma-70 family RNA polymerase sigma factor [Pirellulaceae bacterium]HMP71164.1 sigma-70 family RNA polymerase sigma factor [Pirellulaceae bacterium]
MNPSIDKQHAFIQQLIDGEAAAWHAFVDDHQRILFAQIISTAQSCNFRLDQGEIEDICAEVFATLLADNMRALRQFRGDCKLSTWLTVITHRICLRELSRFKQQRNAHCTESAPVEDCVVDADPLGGAIWREQMELVRSKLHDLKPLDRKILELHFDERLSHEEISRRIGISINSVGPKLHRSVKRLRRLLEAP